MRDTAVKRVREFLESNAGKEFCDECISTRLSLGGRRAAWRATKILGTQMGYGRSKKVCPVCGSNRMVIVKRAK